MRYTVVIPNVVLSYSRDAITYKVITVHFDSA